MAINNVSLKGKSLTEAIELLQTADDMVTLKILRKIEKGVRLEKLQGFNSKSNSTRVAKPNNSSPYNVPANAVSAAVSASTLVPTAAAATGAPSGHPNGNHEEFSSSSSQQCNKSTHFLSENSFFIHPPKN